MKSLTQARLGHSNSPPLTRAIRVLLIEDNSGDARLIRDMLEEHQRLELFHQETLAAALAHLDTDPAPDVILLDLALPDSFGLTTLERLLAVAPGIPIVVLTGHDDDALAVQTVQAGAQDYLPKAHLSFSLLTRSLQHAIERKRLEESLRQSFELIA